MTVLVTGGAGYIGAHVVHALAARGEDVLVVDDLSTGVVGRVRDVPLVRLDLAAAGAASALAGAVAGMEVDAVIHLAAKKRVDESIVDPIRYFDQNIGGLVAVLEAVRAIGCRDLVFSSSAAVYGPSQDDVVEEGAPTRPMNPYGQTKLAGEWLAAAAAAATGALRACSLRYFNVAGAGSPALADVAAANLVPLVVDALRRGDRPRVFGTDHPTPDGTCLRDYVHVVDLAEAHLAALDGLRRNAASSVYNVGTGVGSSVREVVDAVAARLGADRGTEDLPRRAGDPSAVVADASRIAAELGWRARLGLEEIVDSAVDASDPVSSAAAAAST